MNRSGVVYAVWAAAITETDGYVRVEFCKSTDGGFSYTPQQVLTDSAFRGLKNGLKRRWIKSNGFPVIAVDTSGGECDGSLYVVWADLRNGPTQINPSNPRAYIDWDPDIYIRLSRDGGNTWLDPIRVNNDAVGNRIDQWFPWVTVDPYGGVNVLFFDSRCSTCNDEWTEAYVARSVDGGLTFSNFAVSNVRFTPCNSQGVSTGWFPEPKCEPAPCDWHLEWSHQGDYLGITSDDQFIYPCWPDNRVRRPEGDGDFGLYQLHVAPIPILDTLKGVLSANKTLTGNYLLTGDLEIPYGKTLTISKGSWIIATRNSDSQNLGIDPARAEIIVRGTLKIDTGTAPGRPIFTSTVKTQGSWYGIRLLHPGRIKSGLGARVEYARVGVTIDSIYTADTLKGFTISPSQIAGIITRSHTVRIINDTVRNVPAGYGIQLDHADPLVQQCVIDDCQYGVYSFLSSSHVRGTRIDGPGTHGIYVATGILSEDVDSLRLVKDTVKGVFSGAPITVNNIAYCKLDSCFIDSNGTGSRSPLGIKAGFGSNVRLSNTKVKNFTTTGFDSFKSGAWLGFLAGEGTLIGNNHFESDSLAKRVVQGGPILDTLHAHGNWWGAYPAYSTWFTGTVHWTGELSGPPAKIVPAESPETASIPEEFSLSQNYPNPFNPSTTIEFSMERSGTVTIDVFNILGQRVRILIRDQYPLGRHHVTWDGRDEGGKPLASGIYLYRLSAGDHVVSRKMVLVK